VGGRGPRGFAVAVAYDQGQGGLLLGWLACCGIRKGGGLDLWRLVFLAAEFRFVNAGVNRLKVSRGLVDLEWLTSNANCGKELTACVLMQ